MIPILLEHFLLTTANGLTLLPIMFKEEIRIRFLKPDVATADVTWLIAVGHNFGYTTAYHRQ